MKIEGSVYKNAIENSKDLIFWVAKNGFVCCCNKAFLSFFQQQKETDCSLICEGTNKNCFCNNLNIKNIDSFFKKDEDWESFFNSLTEIPILYESIYVDEIGNRMPVEFYASKVTDNDRVLIVAKDTTERKKFEFKIKQVTNELIRSNKDLQEFAYIASHDLKEPLRKISMFSDRLIIKLNELKKDEEIKNKLVDKECEAYLEKITQASSRMEDLIGSILEYSRIGTSGEELKNCDVKKIIEDAVENCEVSLNESGGKIVVEDLAHPCVFCDYRQIHQVFQNLISNSIKFKKENSQLVIRVGQKKNNEGSRVTFFVEDNGIGIKEGFCDKIFLPFQKLHSKSKFKGHGMGLSICKKIIERHGGKITAQSVENEWSRIEFDLQMCKQFN